MLQTQVQVKAIIVLIVVIAVQQLEAHGLQPVLMGRAVHVRPLAVALSHHRRRHHRRDTRRTLAVPIAACVSAAVKYLVGKGTNSTDSKDTVDQALGKHTE